MVLALVGEQRGDIDVAGYGIVGCLHAREMLVDFAALPGVDIDRLMHSGRGFEGLLSVCRAPQEESFGLGQLAGEALQRGGGVVESHIGIFLTDGKHRLGLGNEHKECLDGGMTGRQTVGEPCPELCWRGIGDAGLPGKLYDIHLQIAVQPEQHVGELLAENGRLSGLQEVLFHLEILAFAVGRHAVGQDVDEAVRLAEQPLNGFLLLGVHRNGFG